MVWPGQESAADAAAATAELLEDWLRLLGPDHPDTLANCAYRRQRSDEGTGTPG
ncbi:hypothetical protein [Streptomyces sp.]|uniref:hypothetical protein n=1 Tax=Streptomyces sp. TaxID=1931 RepID=UPI002F4207F1